MNDLLFSLLTIRTDYLYRRLMLRGSNSYHFEISHHVAKRSSSESSSEGNKNMTEEMVNIFTPDCTSILLLREFARYEEWKKICTGSCSVFF